MDALPRVLGPAPSELPLEVFMNTRLKAERARVSKSLEAFRLGAVPTWEKRAQRKALATAKRAASPRKAASRDAVKFLASMGLTLEEAAELVKEELRASRSDTE